MCTINIRLFWFYNVRKYFYNVHKIKNLNNRLNGSSIKEKYLDISNVNVNSNKNEIFENLQKKKIVNEEKSKNKFFTTNGKHVKNMEYILNEFNEFVSIDQYEKRREKQNTMKCMEGGTKKSEAKREEKNKEKLNHKKDKTNVSEEEDDESKLDKLLKKRNVKKDIVTITDKAKYEIKKIIEDNNKENKNENYVLKLFFITKGCNGLTHSFNFINKDDIHKNDEIIYDDTKKKNILLVIDSNCILYVINTTLDYYKDDLTEKFIFTNPNITSVCPCGTSFHFSKKEVDKLE
ncbi:iron-sulfur assembly protein, putative [Plasmodium malariae]|uniref:HesB-like domain containing protein n=2 Tax=Plasmodium (Plasmodium) TaxID=418103 RepID=A0A1A8W0B0_PLAMA|nr:iron-sulfur assembly protein, putative [Plasmodium malariae]SBS84577.1 HesB-like domain containing protein [Plasmodium malariae]SCN12211.1 iron-sulfur assembly protein, putative [Plasmodium malariae]